MILSFLHPALPSKTVISVNWEDFHISSQGNISMFIVLRNQIISKRRPSPSALGDFPSSTKGQFPYYFETLVCVNMILVFAEKGTVT